MDTGENKLSAEMMKKLYEAYKLDTKKKIDEFNEAARKIISDKEYPEAEEVLKLVEDTLIADNHERTIHDPSTKVDLKSVIHMRWPKQDLSNLKLRAFRYGKVLQDQALINYATGDCLHIDMMILDSLATFGPDINSGYGLSTPNLNDIDKKKLERVIKRRKKK